MNLASIFPGSAVFIDTDILIYSRTGKSHECTRFLAECASGNITAYTSTLVLAEFSHRMMMIECKEMGLTAANPAQAMRHQPALVRNLSIYADDVRQLLGGGLTVESVLASDFHVALELQAQFGLLPNDSLNLAVCRRLGLTEIATTSGIFDHVLGLIIYKIE
jgi:predicted nucleic acid-binding protein